MIKYKQEVRETSLFVLNRGEIVEKEIISKVKEPILKIVEEASLHLYDLCFVKEEGHYFLRVSIEKEDKTMDFDTCEKISEKVSELLDQLDPIEHEYILEVCSPGVERPLKEKKDFYEAIHDYIHVDLKEPFQTKKSFEGDLIEVNEENITIEYKDKTRKKTIVISYENIEDAHLAIKF